MSNTTTKAFKIFASWLAREGKEAELPMIVNAGITAEMTPAERMSRFLRYSRIGAKSRMSRFDKRDLALLFENAINHATAIPPVSIWDERY